MDPSRTNSAGVTNLMILAARGDLSAIHGLPLTPELVGQRDDEGNTAWSYATPIVELYLSSFLWPVYLPWGRENSQPVELMPYPADHPVLPCDRYVIMLSPGHFREGFHNFTEQTFRSALLRGISQVLPLEDMCQALNQFLPDPTWMKHAYLFRYELPPKESRLILDYQGSASMWMNRELRENPQEKAKINRIIDRMNPLPNDVMVFRKFRHEKYPETGRIVHQGYLSTSLNPNFVMDMVLDTRERFLRLMLPAGSKALYLGTQEWEMLLPHGLTLDILCRRKAQIPYQNKTAAVWVYDAMVVL